VALGAGAARLALAALGLPGITGWMSLALITGARVALMCSQGAFWSLPTAVFVGRRRRSRNRLAAR
jgi:hypothetical protein